MATFLVTRKMHPALAARVEASVRGKRRGREGSAFAPRVVSAFRLVLALAVVSAVGAIAAAERRDRRALEQARAALLDDVRARGASFTAADAASLGRVEATLARVSGAYEGDVLDAALRGPGALDAILARPAVYVRGPIGAFSRSATIAEAAAASFADPLLGCLVDPPPSRAEKALLPKVRAAYAGQVAARAANVARLHHAIVGSPFLLPAWSDAVRAARDLATVARLREAFAKAPIDEAKRAARATLLIAALDEPGRAGDGATELDGERPHDVRVVIVDLAAGRVLLRARRRVDPSGLSAAARSQYASGVDGCALALDVREALK